MQDVQLSQFDPKRSLVPSSRAKPPTAL